MSIVHPTPPRRILRRGGAAVLVAGFLSLLMVWTAGPVSALEPTPLVPIAKSIGTVEAGAETKIVQRALCAGSVVCGVVFTGFAVVELGTLTSDTWLPWLNNQWDQMLADLHDNTVPFDLLTTGADRPPLNDFSSSMWSVTLTAPQDGASHVLTAFSAASVCRTPAGLRYQVNKEPLYQTGIRYYTTDTFYWNGSTGYTNTVTGWSTLAQSTPSTALDNTTPNPARGRQGGDAQTTADQSNLCNAGDALEGSHVAMQMTAHSGTAWRVFDYGSAVNAATGDYRVQTGCRRPDGSTYSKVLTSNAGDSPVGPGVKVPACDGGDTATGGAISQGGKLLTTWTNPQSGYEGTGDVPDPATSAGFTATWTASSTTAGWDASHLGDGNGDGSQAHSWAAGGAVPQWVQADLGAVKSIGGYRIIGSGTVGNSPTGWTVSTSTDGSTWTQRDAQTGQAIATAAGAYSLPSGVNARYVRLTVGTIPNASPWVPSMSELTIVPGSPTVTTASPEYVSCTSGTPCAWTVKVNGVQCTPAIAACASWTQTAKTTPSAVQCLYGPYVMPLSSCYWMERSFEGISVPATAPNTDGNPDTYTGPQPSWQATPTPTATATATASPTVTQSPTATGTLSPSPTATSTATATATSTVGTGTGTDPSTWPGAAGSPAPGSDGGECFPSGWGVFNPVGWVVQPLKCAFIPNSSNVQARYDETTAKLQGVGVGPVITAVSGNFSHLHSGGCGGVNMPFNVEGQHQDVRLFACDTEPFSTAATYTRAISGVFIVIGGGIAIARALSAAFGLNFSMGKGGGAE